MDEKLNAALKGIYDSLTDEQKEKAKACRTMEELTALAAKEGIELPEEALDMVAGGYPVIAPPDCPYCKNVDAWSLGQSTTITPAGESGKVSVNVFVCNSRNRTFYYSKEKKKYYDDTYQPMSKPSSSSGC